MEDERASQDDMPVCQKCQKPVSEFSVGRAFRKGQMCFFEAKCHGETERYEYWPKNPEVAPFEPKRAFPCEHPPKEMCVEPPAASDDRSPLAIQDELVAMPEWKTLARIRHFNASQKLFRANAKELRDLLLFMTKDPKGFALTSVRNRAHLDEAMDEVIRRMHNFVAAALSLVDHARVFYKELYEKPGSFPDYVEHVKARLAENPDVQFVNCLRQFAQHYKLPDVTTKLQAEQGKGVTIQLLLSKANLETFSGWNATAKKYLQAANEEIDLMAVLDTYEATILEFYKWVAQRQQEIHAKDIAAVEEKRKELLEAHAAELPGLMDGMLEVYAKGIGSFADVFATALSATDHVELAPLEGDLPKWTDEAIERIEKRFGSLPAELVTRLRDAARGK